MLMGNRERVRNALGIFHLLRSQGFINVHLGPMLEFAVLEHLPQKAHHWIYISSNYLIKIFIGFAINC